jgi:hypothetical protein
VNCGSWWGRGEEDGGREAGGEIYQAVHRDLTLCGQTGRWSFASYGFLLVNFLALSIVDKLILAFDTLGAQDQLALAEHGGLLIHSKGLVDLGS